MTFWEFWHAHPFLAWCALWLIWAVVPLTQSTFLIVNRVLRSVKVLCRGWPPPHLDADGDWRPLPKDPEP